MASTSRGAKKRTVSCGRIRVVSENVNVDYENKPTMTARKNEEGHDSGLSSESSTPTAGSPIPRHGKPISSPINIVQPVSKLRISNGRSDNEKVTRVGRTRSVTDSPCSTDSIRSRQFSSPLRTSRNIQSPSLDSGDEGSLRVDRDTYQYMHQDIVCIKTMLLKLKRVLQEIEENSLTRADTLNPFDSSVKNGLFCNVNEGGAVDVNTSLGSGGNSIADELADLRRQVVFLQGQVEDRDRTIQFQVSKLQGPNGADCQTCASVNNHNNMLSTNMCNAATQTDKSRPVSAGPSLLQTQDGLMGPLVSWSDFWDQHCPTLLAELNGDRSLQKSADRTSYPIRCQGKISHQQNEYADKLSVECLLSKRTPKSKEVKSVESGDAKERDLTREKSPMKSYIPTVERLSTQILIPELARP